MPPPTALAVVEFLTIDASARPDVTAMRALLAQSGKSAEAWLAATLVESRRYSIASQARVAAALEVAGRTARDCTDVTCLVQLGRALGVERVVAGRVSKLSNLIWFLSATMVDVSTGRLRAHEEFELKGDIVDLLPKGARAMARRLAASDTAPMMADAPEPPAAARAVLAGVWLTREQVLAALDSATERRPADFSGSDLSGLDLSGVDFKRANLTRCRLVGTNLARANMFAVKLDDAVAHEADFTGTVLDVAWMRRIDLSRAILREASLYATLLTGANLTDADLTRARLIAAMGGAILRRARLANANFGADPGNQPMGLMRTDATGADFTEVDLSGANLRKVNLTRADLTRADLTGADLTGAELAGTILRAIRGRDTIRGLDQAKYLDRAVFNE
ncbi:MAG: pentapeptide repeat-containing protein [Gemmatimonadales bacterium]